MTDTQVRLRTSPSWHLAQHLPTRATLALLLASLAGPSTAQPDQPSKTSQSSQLTFSTGAAWYNGDLSYDAFSSARIRPALSLGWARQTSHRLGWAAQLLYGRLGASDSYGRNVDRNLSFETALLEASVLGRLSLGPSSNDRVIPYLTAGIALFHVNPYTTLNGNKTRLYPYSTQGQGLPGYEGRYPTPKTHLAIPVGGGIDIRLNDNWRMEIDLSFRKTFTDQIDDVGGYYPDRKQLLDARGATAVALSYRGSGSFPAKGSPRGNPNDKDWYSTFSLRLKTPLTRKITKPPTPPENLVPLLPDRDGDNVPDIQDQCPLVAGTPKYAGCPVPDTDRDGINDEKDRCPNVAGSSRYDGCPIPDNDKDGINDEVDKCPTLPGQARYEGCPIPDTDQDGLHDEIDRCPKTPGPTQQEGCPLPPVDSANLRFLPGTAKATPGTLAELDRLAAWLIGKAPHLVIRIEARPLLFRDRKTALQLAEKRSGTILTYLVAKGVSADRVEFITIPLEPIPPVAPGPYAKTPVTVFSFQVHEKP